jgi:hypothetical protein
MPIARQRLGKHILKVTLSIIGHSLLGNGTINTHSRQKKTVFSVWSMTMNYKRAQSGELKEYEEYKEYNGERERDWWVS